MNIKEKLQALLVAANNTTAAADTDITAAVRTLIDGYGQGGGLPTEYQAVEYIVSSNTQYIDSGVIGTSNIKIRADMEFMSGSTGMAFGEREVSGSNQINRLALLAYNTVPHVYYYWSSGTYPYYTGDYGRHIYDCVYGSLYVDGVREISENPPISDWKSTLSIYVFANNESGNVSDFSAIKLYSIKMFDGGNTVRDFIPCYRKCDGVVGLYDLCGSTCPLTGTPFYINFGSGIFAKGADAISNEEAYNIIMGVRE